MAYWKIPVSHDVNNITWTLVTFDSDGEYSPSNKEGYPPQYKYSIRIDNERFTFYTTEKLASDLRALGVTIGTVVYLGRLGEKTATLWQMQYVSGPTKDWSGFQAPSAPASAVAPPPPPPPPPPTVPSGSGGEQPPGNQPLPPPLTTIPSPPPMYSQQDLSKVILPYESDEVQAWGLRAQQNMMLLSIAHGHAVTAWPEIKDVQSEFLRTMAISAFIETTRQMKGLSGWKVGEYVAPPDPNTVDGKLALIAIEVEKTSTLEAYAGKLFDEIAKHHSGVKHANHAKAIIKILGYAGTTYKDMRDEEFWHEMAKEIWVYEDGRAEGLSRNEVLDVIAAEFNRPKDLMEYETEAEDELEDEQILL